MDLSKTILIVFVLCALGLAAEGAGDYYYSVNLGCENNKLKLGGGRVLVGKNKPLKAGSLIQYISAGEDGVPNEAAAGDDVLLKESKVGSDRVWKCFANAPGLFYDNISGRIERGQTIRIFARAWKDKGHYGDSKVITVRGNRTIIPLPSDIGLKSFYVNKAVK